VKAINIRFHEATNAPGHASRRHVAALRATVPSLRQASTTSRYLKIDQQRIHNALKAFEKARGEDAQSDTQISNADDATATMDAQKLL
jgi:hypothetical protein